MPTQEPYQPLNINTGSSQAAITAAPNVTPALGDLMENIKSGFISASDIQKRALGTPLEFATRQQDMADMQTIRPAKREAVTATLGNIQAKEQFEATTLPILNATKRANLEQAHNNALEFGVPDEILKVFYASVPGFIPFDPEKLHDKKTGQVNIPYANEMIVKAKQAAAKMAATSKFVGPVKQSTTDASGKMTETTTVMDQISGEAVGAPITTETKAADMTKAAGEAGKAAEGLRKEFYQADTIQMFNKVDAAVRKIRLSATPESTAFQDMSSIFSFMKVLDPGSTVREGEYATAEKSRGWPEWARAYYNRAASGQKLTPEQKRQVLSSAEENYQGQLGNALPTIRQFADLENRNNFSAGTVIPVEFRALLESPAAVAAAPGSGGNLADMSIEQLKNVPIEGRGAGAGENPVVSSEQARVLPPEVKFFRLVPGGPLKWNPNHPDSPAQQRLRATSAPQGNLADKSIEELKEISIVP